MGEVTQSGTVLFDEAPVEPLAALRTYQASKRIECKQSRGQPSGERSASLAPKGYRNFPPHIQDSPDCLPPAYGLSSLPSCKVDLLALALLMPLVMPTV